MTLPVELHSLSQVRLLESAAIAAGIPGYTLMTRAGESACAILRRRWPEARRLVVVAGPGNNGGDGLVLARLAMRDGLAVKVMLAGSPADLRGEAALACGDFLAESGALQEFDAASLAAADVVVDALLGIGARAPLRADWQAIIEAVNRCGRPVLSIDLPSGLDADSGRAMPAMRADATLCFIALKQGLYLGNGPEHAGELFFDALGLRAAAVEPVLRRIRDEEIAKALVPRPRDSHKSRFGRVTFVGGGIGMPGAVRLAAEAALCVGAGLVTVASLPEHLAAIVAVRPELMFRALPDAAAVAGALEESDVIVIGPGLGRSNWAREVLAATLSARQPRQRLLLDADALNLVADGVGLQRCEDWVLTPHPGEAARLLNVNPQSVQQDRPAALASLCQQRGGTVVLKGATTLVGELGEIPRLCDRGNPGMAVPGMGDVLTGAIAGLLAQGGTRFACAVAGVQAHAQAGDRCASHGIRGVLALEVAHELRAVLAALP